MHAILTFIKNLHESGHLQEMIRHGGIPIMALIVFAETGLLVGFFLPGDTMLFLAGVAAATIGPTGKAYLNIWVLNLVLVLAAILGNQLGYFFGFKTGHAIFTRKDGLFFKKVYAERAHEFYLKNGVFAVIFARFIPVLRSFVPFMAGVAEMTYTKYLLVDCIGGFSWITIMIWIGFLLGREIDEKHLPYVLLGISLVSFIPLIITIVKSYLKHRSEPVPK